MLYRSLRIYWKYFLRFFMARMAYKVDFFATLFAGMLITGSGLLFVVFLIDGKVVPSLNGWTRHQVLFIYGYSLIATGLFSTVSRNLYEFGDRYIIQGQLDRVLLRPLNSLFQVIFESFHLEGMGTMILGGSVLYYTAGQLDMSWSLFDVAWFVVSIISGSVLLLCVMITVATVSFHFEDRIGVVPPVYSLIQFGRYPLNIYNRFLQLLLSWLIPIGFVAFYPASYFFAIEDFRTLCFMTPFVTLAWCFITATAWSWGLSRYTSTGS